MTALTDRLIGAAGDASTPTRIRSRIVVRAIAALVAHRRSLLWIAPVLAIAVVVSAVNLGGAPQRIDDEGTYTAQAWAIFHLHELAHYTYWYDHPPLGWIQLALYAQLTGAFARYSIAVLAMREAMVVLTLVSIVLLWVLARRIRLPRPAAAAAAALFALSPLALQFHRTVYLDNVATPWLLASLILVLSRRAQLAAFAGAALCFGVAVLSKETFLLALPLLVVLAVRGAHPETRRYSLAVAGSVLVLVGGGYLLLAAIKGELVPSAGHVSLLTGVTFQLGTRASSGSVFDPSSLASVTLGQWWKLDPVFIVAALASAVAALALRRLRPFAVTLLALVAVLLRPGGYIPVPFVIMLVPFAALLVAGVGAAAVTALVARRRRVLALATVIALGAAVVGWVPLAVVQLRGFLLSDLDAPMRQAESWIGGNVPHQDRLIVDDAMWVDLVQQGRPRSDVVWYYKVDTDPAVEKQSPQGWRDADYVVTTNSMRTFPDAFPRVRSAIDNSTVVASFGTGVRRVDVRRVHPEGLAAARAEARADAAERTLDGTALASNPGLAAPADATARLRAGEVDERIVVALGSILSTTRLRVDGFPVVAGDTSTVSREVAVTRIGDAPAVVHGRASSASRRMLAELGADYAPSRWTVRGDQLVLSYSADATGGPNRADQNQTDQ